MDTQNLEYYSALKRKEISFFFFLTPATAQTNLEDATLSVRNQTRRTHPAGFRA